MPTSSNRKPSPTSKKGASQPETTDETSEPTFEERFGTMGENAAPDNPLHLMPGATANGGNYITNDRKDDGPMVDDLEADEKAARGYPDPEITPKESMSSTRDNGSYMEQVEGRLSNAHDALTDKLDSISEKKQQEELVAAASTKNADDVDWSALPGAPKDGIIIGPDQPLKVTGTQHGNTVVVDQNVYRAVQRFRTKRWSFNLLHYKGQQVPVQSLVKVNDPTENKDEIPLVKETKEQTPENTGATQTSDTQ